MALDESNTNNPELEELLESAAEQRELEEEIRKENEQSGSRFGSAIGLLIAVPVGIYSYINGPDRYSAERLEKEAQKKATKEVKKIIKSSKKNFTEDEREVLHEKAKREYYDNYATYHEKRARKLAQDPKTNNPFLKRALSYKDARDTIAKATAEAQKDKPRQFSPITGKESFYNDARATIAKANEKAQKDKSAQFSTLPPREETPSGSSNMRTPSVSRPSMPRGGTKPTTPSVPGKAAPKITGNKRGLPHLPKPGLPGIPNPIQNIRTLAMFFNPTNIIIFSLIGIFIAVFFIVFTVGGGGGGGGTAGGGGGQQPAPPVGGQSTYTFVALGDSLTAWPCYPVDAGCVNSHPWGSYDFTGNPWPTHLAKIDTNLILKHNGGIPAEASDYIESQFGAQVTPYHPDVLFVLAGTNDAGNGITNPEVTKTNIEKIISDAKSVGIKKVILLTIPHQCGGGYTGVNNAIKTLAGDYSPVIDISGTSVLTCTDFQQSDKLHLTDAGALKLADYIDAQIKALNLLPVSTQGTLTQTPSEAYYCQWQGAWANLPYDGETYAKAGCTATSMAMILSSYGYTQTPDQVGAAFTNSPLYLTCGSNPVCPNPKLGYCTCTGTWNPTVRSLTPWLDSTPFQSGGVSAANYGPLNLTVAKQFLDNNYLLLAGVRNWRGVGGHSIVIEFVDPITGDVRVRDPNNCREKFVTVNVYTTLGSDGNPLEWYYAIPVKPK